MERPLWSVVTELLRKLTKDTQGHHRLDVLHELDETVKILLRHGSDADAVIDVLPVEAKESACVRFHDQVLKVTNDQTCSWGPF